MQTARCCSVHRTCGAASASSASSARRRSAPKRRAARPSHEAIHIQQGVVAQTSFSSSSRQPISRASDGDQWLQADGAAQDNGVVVDEYGTTRGAAAALSRRRAGAAFATGLVGIFTGAFEARADTTSAAVGQCKLLGCWVVESAQLQSLKPIHDHPGFKRCFQLGACTPTPRCATPWRSRQGWLNGSGRLQILEKYIAFFKCQLPCQSHLLFQMSTMRPLRRGARVQGEDGVPRAGARRRPGPALQAGLLHNTTTV